MLKKVVACIVLLVISSLGLTQEVEIYLFEQDIEVSGTVVDVSNGDIEIHQEFDVKNVSESTRILRVTRVKVIELVGTEDRICWGTSDSSATCYPYFSVAPNNSFTTAVIAEVESGGQGWLSTVYMANGNAGCAQYRYYIIDDTDEPLDSVDVQFCSTVNVKENEVFDFEVYPNPTHDILNIMSKEDNVQFKLFNINGDFILSQVLVAGENQICLDKLENGIYFSSITKEEGVKAIQKIVIAN